MGNTAIEKIRRQLPEVLKLRKIQAAILAGTVALPAVLALKPNAASASSFGSVAAEQPFDVPSAYPNFDMVHAGYGLVGINRFLPGYDPANPTRTGLSILRFQDLGGLNIQKFRQYNTYDNCHWDSEQWNLITDTLQYTGTYSGCASDSTDIEFSPGISFMPESITVGQEWELAGVSQTALYKLGSLACMGINTWESEFAGTEILPTGSLAYNFKTVETQTLRPVSKSFASACRNGAGTGFKWVETFQLVNQLDIQQGANTANPQPGLAGDKGGKPESFNTPNGTNWDNQFHWQLTPATAPAVSLPPLGAG